MNEEHDQLPTSIGGYQHVVYGLSQDGDIWVRDGKPVLLATAGISLDGEFATISQKDGWFIYRKMPVAGHDHDDLVKETRFVLVENNETTSGEKPSNPKDIVGSDKLPIHLWPTTATALGSLALLEGALKYGRSNFRSVGVRASIYYDALNRHMNAWFEGEDTDPDSLLPHLAHALACLAILVDAQAAGKLNDDRVYPAEYREFADAMTPHVKRLKEKYKDKSPKHYTISDKQ